jgi:hypothetical protein
MAGAHIRVGKRRTIKQARRPKAVGQILDDRRQARTLDPVVESLANEAGDIVTFEDGGGVRGQGNDRGYTSVADVIQDFTDELAAVEDMQVEGDSGGEDTEPAMVGLGSLGDYTQHMLERPQQLGVALKHNKKDKRDTGMQMGLHLFEPIRIYFGLLHWPKVLETLACDGEPADVAWLELLCDFWALHGWR